MSMCLDACQSAGEWGELLGLALIGTRLVFAEFKRRKLATTNVKLQQQTADLREEIVRLSNFPAPRVPVVKRDAVPSLDALSAQISRASVVEPSLNPPAQPSPQDGVQGENEGADRS